MTKVFKTLLVGTLLCVSTVCMSQDFAPYDVLHTYVSTDTKKVLFGKRLKVFGYNELIHMIDHNKVLRGRCNRLTVLKDVDDISIMMYVHHKEGSSVTVKLNGAIIHASVYSKTNPKKHDEITIDLKTGDTITLHSSKAIPYKIRFTAQNYIE